MSIRVRIVPLIVAITLGGVTVSGLAAPHSAHSPRYVRVARRVAIPPRDVPVDFNGNEVRQAIARYKVDPTGALYEEHSPDTEVPRLGSPKG